MTASEKQIIRLILLLAIIGWSWLLLMYAPHYDSVGMSMAVRLYNSDRSEASEALLREARQRDRKTIRKHLGVLSIPLWCMCVAFYWVGNRKTLGGESTPESPPSKLEAE